MSFILAGDIGGTKTRLALLEMGRGSLLQITAEKSFESKLYRGFEECVHEFLDQLGKDKVPDAACFGVPGPVRDGAVKTTNLPWSLCEKDLASAFGIPRIKLINDLGATAFSLPYLGREDLKVLHPGNGSAVGAGGKRRRRKMRAVLAPGTGLGMAYLLSVDQSHHVIASEGGHTAFAPRSDEEMALFTYLRKKLGRVRYEDVICGPGLANIYSFLCESGPEKESAETRELMRSHDAAAVIAQRGQEGKDPLSARALAIFINCLVALAGDLALMCLPESGVYLGGEFPPKLCKLLQNKSLIQTYINKGLLSYTVESTPLYLIKNDRAPLIGAAYLALME